MEIVFTGMQGVHETLGSLLFGENVGYFIELFKKNELVKSHFVTWITSRMSLTNYGLLSD